MKHSTRGPDDEVAVLVGGVWYYVCSEIEYGPEGDEHRFVTRVEGRYLEVHFDNAHIQAVAWEPDQ